ncbi:MAG: ABC transporter substrate-binding protein [Patescibacteria group bacterium]
MRCSRFFACLLPILLLPAASFAAAGTARAVRIRVWLHGFAPYREALIRDFEAAYPGLTLDLTCQTPDGGQEKLLAAIASGRGPDLALVEMAWVGGLLESGHCAPLGRFISDLRDLSALSPPFLHMLAADGKTWGVPVAGHPLALYLRQDWLTKLGLSPPTTWEELAKVAEAFTRKDPDGNGKNDTWGLAERWPAGDPAVATRFLPLLYQAGGFVAVEKDGAWSAGFGLAAGVRALRFRRRLWEAGLIPPGAPANDAGRNLALFTSGQAGMVVEDDRAVPAVRQALGNRAATVPLPREIRAGTVGDGLCFVLSARSNCQAAAFTFVQWWLDKAVQEKLILGWDGRPGGTGAESGALCSSPRRDIDPALLLKEPLYSGFARSFAYMSPEPYYPNYASLRLVIARAVAAAMEPGTPVEAALAAGMKEAETLLCR